MMSAFTTWSYSTLYCGVTIIVFWTSALVSAVVLDLDNYEISGTYLDKQSVYR